MGFRLLAFLPVALLLTMLCLLTASTLVSAIEVPFPEVRPGSIDLRLHETSCDVLAREIRDLGHRATDCDRDLLCLDSPILCPILFGKEEAREYARLQARFDRDCSGRRSGTQVPWDAQRRFEAELAYCDPQGVRGGSGAMTPRIEPSRFLF
ncbi:MAG TPA: hypothetical protein ENI85_10650 [Deltaproteobacteria bacterium]|nr:hypothetical protein [Deltaproteobacteria bacterium]